MAYSKKLFFIDSRKRNPVNLKSRMNIEIVYCRSPLGVLEIRSTGSAISDVLFVNSWKGAKINEEELSFVKPKTLIVKAHYAFKRSVNIFIVIVCH